MREKIGAGGSVEADQFKFVIQGERESEFSLVTILHQQDLDVGRIGVFGFQPAAPKGILSIEIQADGRSVSKVEIGI